MSRRMLLTVVIFSVLTGIVIGFMRALPDDFVDESGGDGITRDYGYRCGDGSEFRLVPSRGLSSIRIIPATSADYVREHVLAADPERPNTTFQSDDTLLVNAGDSLNLSVTGHATTQCLPMFPSDESFFPVL